MCTCTGTYPRSNAVTSVESPTSCETDLPWCLEEDSLLHCLCGPDGQTPVLTAAGKVGAVLGEGHTSDLEKREGRVLGL